MVGEVVFELVFCYRSIKVAHKDSRVLESGIISAGILHVACKKREGVSLVFEDDDASKD